MTPVVAYDATHENVGALPPGPAAGYTTGSSWIAWTAADWAAHPGAVRIDQDWRASDYTADVLDVESGAATPAECATWWTRASAEYEKQTRPGQRLPAIYGNQSTLPLVASALRAAGITSGPVFWVARVTDQQTAESMLGGTFSGFPVIGVQFDYSHSAYDVNVFDSGWLNPAPAPKPTQEDEMFVRASSNSTDTPASVVAGMVFQVGAGYRHWINDPGAWGELVNGGATATPMTGDHIRAQWPAVAPVAAIDPKVLAAAIVAAFPAGTGSGLTVTDVETAVRAVLHNA